MSYKPCEISRVSSYIAHHWRPKKRSCCHEVTTHCFHGFIKLDTNLSYTSTVQTRNNVLALSKLSRNLLHNVKIMQYGPGPHFGDRYYCLDT